MRKIVLYIERECNLVLLCSTSIFPPLEADRPVISWNTRSDGKGIGYEGLQTIQALSSFHLYARYPGLTRLLTYYDTDGGVESETVKEYYTLKDSSFNGFRGWIVKGNLVTPPFLPTKVTEDIAAMMSCYGMYELSYDSNGGSGTIASERKEGSRWVDLHGTVQSNASRVALARNAFSKTFIADDALSYDLVFGKWLIGKSYYNEGDYILLDHDIKSIVLWYYPVFYKAEALCSPLGAAKIDVIGSGSTALLQRLSNIKTLSMHDILSGYLFKGWYDEYGSLKSTSPTFSVAIDKQLPSATKNEVKVYYTAKFNVDSKYTIVVDVNSISKMKNISGKLTRSALLNDSLAAYPNESKLKLVYVRGR